MGAVTPAAEIARAWAFRPFAFGTCDLATAGRQLGADAAGLANYLARPSPILDGLLGPSPGPSTLARPAAGCWPDLPFDPRLDLGRLSIGQLRHDHGDAGSAPPPPVEDRPPRP